MRYYPRELRIRYLLYIIYPCIISNSMNYIRWNMSFPMQLFTKIHGPFITISYQKQDSMESQRLLQDWRIKHGKWYIHEMGRSKAEWPKKSSKRKRESAEWIDWSVLYLQATSTVAGCPRIWPGPDHATHSHLNLSLPKYSSTSFLVTFNSTSTTLVPVRGSTKSWCCERSARSPLQRKYTCNAARFE